MLKYILPLAAALAFTLPVQADPYENAVQLDVLPGWRMDDGQHMAALRLSLAKGWKTYWRSPGDAGVPPMFDWRRSKNITGAEIIWPTPVVFSQSGMRSVGYSGEVILPLKLSTRDKNGALRLKGVIDIGVCKEICVPRRMKINVTLPADQNRPVPAIAAAMAERPFNRQEAGVTSVKCTFSPDEDGYGLIAKVKMPSTGSPEYAVVETANPQIWVPESKVSRKGNMLTIKTKLVHVAGESFLIDRSGIRLTVLGSRHAVDIRGCLSD